MANYSELPGKPVWLHETAIADEGARIGAGTKLWHWVHVQGNAVIGEHCSLGQNVYVGKAVIGNNVKIQNNVSVYDAVTIEDDVFCGPSMVFTNVINPRSHIVRKQEYKPTLVRQGATIGANAVVVCGNTIDQYAMIGAGSVVTRNVPAFALVVGNPARQIGWVCQCGIRLRFDGRDGHCQLCGWKYQLIDRKCVPAL
jgi:UDP-2-acetamido-3-amino-2,3-dideoxy-glucuronate N-acetyltransferase